MILKRAGFVYEEGKVSKSMADYLKRNLMQLRNNNPVVKENFEHTEKMIEIQKKKDQHNIYLKEGRLYFVYEDKEYRLASIEPKKEAEYMIRNLESMKDHLVVVFGMANIELLKKLLLDTTKNTKIAVFEPNNDVFLYCMKNYNLCDMIASPKFGFLIGDKPMLDREIPVYFNSSWMNLVHNIQVIAIPNYYIYKEFMADVMKRISSEIDSALLCLGNSLPDMMDGLVNHYLNVDASIEASDCRELEGSYEGIPAIVVASGPSLDKNIDDLKLAQGKALILACDASYQICIEHGIQPDAIVSLERGEPTYNAFYKGRTFDDKLVLIGPSLLWPKIHEEFPGKQLLYAKNHTGLEGWWMDIFPNSQYASLGHSCATAAYAVARKAGCDPVILIGQDLAYTDDKKHSDRVHSDSFQTDNELTEEEKESKDLWVEDIYGGKVRTSETFNLFRHYFEDAALAKGTMIDATEGGALIRGTKVMTLKEAIERYCGKDLEKKLYELLSDRPITSQERLEKYNKVIEKTEGMLD